MPERKTRAIASALYEKSQTDAASLIPTRLARGPWQNDAQHGGPIQGLLARAIEQHPSAKPMQIVRFTCDLWRAAAFQPVTVSVRTLREGKSAEWLEAEVAAAVRARGACALCLSGGRTPEPVFRELALAAEIDWTRVSVFFGDERAVPPDHPQSNYRMVHAALLSRVPIPAASVHRMEAERPDRDAAAREYERLLPPALDLLVSDLAELARWRTLRGQGDRPLLRVELEDGAPEEIQEVAARITALTARDLPLAQPHDPIAELGGYVAALSAPERENLRQRVLEDVPADPSAPSTFPFGTAVGDLLAALRVHVRPVASLDRILAEIEAVTRDQVAEIAAEYFAPERQNLVRLGPSS